MGEPRRGWVLVVLGTAQLMVFLDNSIVNIALPSAQADLGFGDAARSWVVTAYTLAFGALLLPGGRIADLLGRRRAFLAGLVGFAVASVLGGLAPSAGTLIAARAVQGAFGAVLAPASLALLSTVFPAGRARARAFGVFSALSGSGAVAGLLLGGALTQFTGWRWCLYVNVVFAVAALAGAVLVVPRGRPAAGARFDVTGALAAVGGLCCVVSGLAVAQRSGWGAPPVVVLVAGGVVLLAGFLVTQRRARMPLLPPAVLADRTRGAGLLAIFVLNVGMFGVSLFLAFVLQRNLGFSPLLAGLATVPMVGGIVLAANLVPTLLLPRTGPRVLLAGGLVIGAGALLWFSRLSVASGYADGILAPLVLLGLGLGVVNSTGMNIATSRVAAADAGAASGLASATLQLGGAVGTPLLSSVAAAATAGRTGSAALALHGYTAAFAFAAVVFVAGAAAVALLTPGADRASVSAPAPRSPNTEERTSCPQSTAP